jgi:hypothetical protein
MDGMSCDESRVLSTATQPVSSPGFSANGDEDGDGLPDVMEDALAEKFAPVVYHGEKEDAFPVNVDWWLSRTRLLFYDRSRSPHVTVVDTGPLQQDTLAAAADSAQGRYSSSPFARSRMKTRSFFLDDVARAFRRGEADSTQWRTYVHSYKNTDGGVSLQYWRAYAWNEASLAGLDFSHGGDWEAVTVHLDAALRPAMVAYLQHTGIAYYCDRVRWEGTHPIVYSEEGSHSSAPDRRALASTRTIRQETWTSGRTMWFGGELRASGSLVNVGERSRPRNRQAFIQYAGLWGAVRRLFITSGYWGPAFNETGARCQDGSLAYRFPFGYAATPPSCGPIFMNAWCDRMAVGALLPARECYPQQETP